MNNLGLKQNLNKRDWLLELKKGASSYKLEESNLIKSFLSEDFHLNKLYNKLLIDDCLEEEKGFKDLIKSLKTNIDDVYQSFKGVGNMRNIDIRYKINKIEEMINKNKLEFKIKFEALLFEEENLEKELETFETELISRNRLNKNNEEENIRNENVENEENDPQIESKNVEVRKNNYTSNKEEIDSYIEYIMSATNIIFDQYPEHVVSKMIEKQIDLDLLKNKAKMIDYIIEKSLNGQNLSWQARDHQDFLKLRTQHKGKINTLEFLNDLENTLPFMPRSELKNHIKMFNKFFQLSELKKLIINRYKDIKTEKEENDKKSILNQINQAKEIKDTPKQDKSQYVKEKKMKLEEWKLQKAQKKKEEFESNQNKLNEMRQNERERYNTYVENVKPILEQYKNMKIIKKQNSLLVQQSEKPMLNEIDLQRIQERNEDLVKQKMFLKKSKSINALKSGENYTKYKMKKNEELSKIKPKLNEETEIHQMKTRKKFDKNNEKGRDACTMGGNILNRGARAVPEWRKGLI
jgi:hypothetical protein